MEFGLKKLKKIILYIINAQRLQKITLIDVSINVISNNENFVKERIESKKADISNNTWKIEDPKILISIKMVI